MKDIKNIKPATNVFEAKIKSKLQARLKRKVNINIIIDIWNFFYELIPIFYQRISYGSGAGLHEILSNLFISYSNLYEQQIDLIIIRIYRKS